MNIFLTILAFALGAAGGAFLAMHLGRPVKAGKAAPYGKRMIPVIIPILLLGLVLRFIPGMSKVFISVLLAAFCLVCGGTTQGLEKRDGKLLEMAFVFRIPSSARMQYIDLPACRATLVRSAQIAGIVSALIGAAGLLLLDMKNVLISQIMTGVVLTAAVTIADIVLAKSRGKKGGAA